MIYDCFIFNDELDLLELRLTFLENITDRFVLVESARTLSGSPKPLYYESNKERFTRFQHKIIHVITPVNDLPAWEYEWFQRNGIKKGLEQCSDTDIIFISDADEIVNIKEILSFQDEFPALIEIPMYYYFMDIRTNARFFVNLVAPWSFLKNKDIGERYNKYATWTTNRITADECNTGWHFSYLYGYDIPKYQEKISSFSHQEFNTAYYLDTARIKRCIQLRIDLFERPSMNLKLEDTRLGPLIPFTRETPLEELLSKKNPVSFSPGNILFVLHKKYYRKIKYRLQQLFTPKDPGTAGR